MFKKTSNRFASFSFIFKYIYKVNLLKYFVDFKTIINYNRTIINVFITLIYRRI